MSRLLPFLFLVTTACGATPSQSPIGADSAADAPVAVDAVAVGDAADAGPGPTPEEWAHCPDNLRDLGYAVTSCSSMTGAFGLTNPVRAMSVEPTWIADGMVGNRAITIEEALARGAARGNEAARALQRCDLHLLPPACRCTDCGTQAFDVRNCTGFERDGRHYLGEQLNLIADMALRTGHCPRLE